MMREPETSRRIADALSKNVLTYEERRIVQDSALFAQTWDGLSDEAKMLIGKAER